MLSTAPFPGHSQVFCWEGHSQISVIFCFFFFSFPPSFAQEGCTWLLPKLPEQGTGPELASAESPRAPQGSSERCAERWSPPKQRTSIPPQHTSSCSSLRLVPKAARPSLLTFEAGQKLFPELPIISPVSSRQEYRSHHQTWETKTWETSANVLDFPVSRRFSFWFA